MLNAFNEGKNIANNNKATGYVKKTQNRQLIRNISMQTQLDVLSSRQQLYRLFSSIMTFNMKECFAATSFQIRISRDLRTGKILQLQTGRPHTSSCVHTHSTSYHYLTIYSRPFEWLLYFHLQVNGHHYTNSVLLKGSRDRSRLTSLTWKQTTDLSVRLSVRLHARQIPRLFVCQTGREVNELKITKEW